MRKIQFLGFIILLSCKLLAAPVDSITAKTIGKNFLSERFNRQKSTIKQSVDLELVSKKTKNGHQDLFYVFNIKNAKGFIIISADDRAFPILGYSFESSFSLSEKDMPDALSEWIETTSKQLEYVNEKNLKADVRTKSAWNQYQNQNFKAQNDVNEVSPLLSTKWNQGTYYNSLCPVGSGGQNGHVWVGCVAVSMAQVMKYWNYPDYGSGEHSYVCSPYGTQSANFATTYYDWMSMPNSLNAENNAVATLLYHCGVSVNMGYAPGGSGAFMGTAAQALKKYFDYSNQIEILYKSSFSETAWDSIMRKQMDLGQPVSYAGGNHAFVIDGYQDINYFHVNWGWGGSYDGYFYMSALNPGSSNFTSGQHAILNIRPNCGQASTSLVTLSDNSGTITDNGGSAYNYMNCSDSKTLISPTGVSKIKLIFSEFNTIAGQDTLYIYDGANESAPLLDALTGKIDPFEVLSSTSKVFLRFKSGNYTTDKGYSINYISSFDDTGVTGLLLPVGKTCGKSNDSIQVVVKNFGINTKTNIPVTVKIKTPVGIETYNKTLAGPLKTFESDTLFVHLLNTSNEGNYDLTCYTKTVGDNLNRANDTTKSTVYIKEIMKAPFSENVDSLNYMMGDWLDKNQSTWIYSENERGNQYFRTYAGSGEGEPGGSIGRKTGQFLVHDRKIGPVTSKMKLYFDYRILGWGQVPLPIELNNAEKIHILVSGDCGDHFDTVYTISSANHIDTAEFTKLEVTLGNYSGQNIIFGFTTEWDDMMASVDYDNFLVVDSSAQVNGILTVNAGKPDFLIYPNPTSGIFKVQRINSSQEALELLVYDISGKMVNSQIVKPNDKELFINIEDQKTGMYFIQIRTKDKMLFGKILKE